MADSSQNKTEQATPRKLERSREKGQVAYSADLVSGGTLLLTTMLIVILGDWFLSSLLSLVAQMLTTFIYVETNAQSVSHLTSSLLSTGLICLPVMFTSFAVSLLFGGSVAGFGIAPKAFELDFGKLNPTNGFSKLFSSRSVLRALMSIFKLTIVSTVVFFLVKQHAGKLSGMVNPDLQQSAELTMTLVIQLMIGVSGCMVVLGILDLAFQKWKHSEDMKMSLQEVRDERKDDDGDPHIRARLRRLQREVSQRSLHDSVSSATVLITNPTHFAVALKYDRNMDAPVVLAKGKDFLALRMIEIAKLNKVAVVERKPLARALYHNVPVDQEIPLELYQLVAEVLSYIQSI